MSLLYAMVNQSGQLNNVIQKVGILECLCRNSNDCKTPVATSYRKPKLLDFNRNLGILTNKELTEELLTEFLKDCYEIFFCKIQDFNSTKLPFCISSQILQTHYGIKLLYRQLYFRELWSPLIFELQKRAPNKRTVTGTDRETGREGDHHKIVCFLVAQYFECDYVIKPGLECNN